MRNRKESLSEAVSALFHILTCVNEANELKRKEKKKAREHIASMMERRSAEN